METDERTTTYADLKSERRKDPKLISYDAAAKRSRAHQVLGLRPDARARMDCINSNRLYGTRLRQLLDLAHILALSTQPAGAASKDGIVNPANTFTQLLASGILDEMPVEDYERLLATTNDLSVLWEGKGSAQSFAMACNALLRTVLQDEDLFFAAYAKTRGRLLIQGRLITGTYGDVHEREKAARHRRDD